MTLWYVIYPMETNRNRISVALRKGRWLFLLMLIFAVFSLWMEQRSHPALYENEDVLRFQETLREKQIQADSLLSSALKALDYTSSDELFPVFSKQYLELSRKGLAIFIYRNDSLVFWSDNYIPVPANHKSFPVRDLVKIANSYFIKREVNSGNTSLIGLILVKTEYRYENRFLQNSFQEDFKLSPEVKINPGKTENGFNEIYSSEGNFLFSLDFHIARKMNPLEKQMSVLLYLVVLILFLFFLRRFIHNAPNRYQKALFFVSTAMVFGLYYASHYYRFPHIIYDLELFSPGKFAGSSWFPSLGDLLLLTVLSFFTIFNFYKEYNINLNNVRGSGFNYILLLLSFLILIPLWFLISIYLLRSLILDSTISFETYKVLNLTIYTFFGFLILTFLFAALALLIDKFMGIMKNLGQRRQAIYGIGMVNLFIFAGIFMNGSLITPESALFFTALSAIIYYIRIYRKGDYRFSVFVSIILLYSVFTVTGVVKYTAEKDLADMKIKAVNLSAEHDPVAELLFTDLEERIRKDSEINALVFSQPFDIEKINKIYSGLQRKYFSGFFDKYDLQITLCGPLDSVYVAPPENAWYHCYDFFEELLLSEGSKVPNTGFYFLGNQSGRISYFAPVRFQNHNKEFTLFIELNSRLISEGMGYPELLLEDKYNPPPSEGEYSYARYSKGRLINFSGSFAYHMSSSVYTDANSGWSFSRKDRYDHLIYNIDSNNTIIVSKPTVFWVDILISFSYVFSFYFLVMVVFLVISNISPVITRLSWNFKVKIQFAFTGLLFFSLLFIGAGIVYFSIRQYQNKHVDILKEKIQSVYVELIHKLEFEKDLHQWSAADYESLDDLLGKFSNVFYTDINMYDGRGELLATSRPEIIANNLIAGRMNTEAYLEMIVYKRSEYIHKENIGGLKYLSAYVPFMNSENELLAYLNLPYFTRQDELTSEIANLVVAIVNILVLMSVLSFAIAVFLSNKITYPLSLLQERFARISLNSRNEKITYTARDEIGSLVAEYNKMVDQLITSAELLAKSERELAWREMAKQIAHEIKNPLTPMRLSIQHLQRAIQDKKSNWEEQFERLSLMLIEQIDGLSAIATEFSNFAKMPLAQNEKLDLFKRLEDSCKLFENTENVKIELEREGAGEIYVFADREQLSRVFINLLKNAIQSIQENREGKIKVKLLQVADKAVIRFQDNGRGIPEEIRDKLFQPNFTTKSGGMGMGLAIVESILQHAGGRIFYETELNKGSVFIVELPVIKNVSNE